MLKAIVVGNVGGDPQLRYGPSGAAFLQFNVASNGRVRDASGEWQDSTEWVRVTVFGQRAETLSQHLARGMKVYVDGRLEAKPWIDRNNQPRAGLEVVANDVEFASSRSDRDDGEQGYSHPPAQQTVNQQPRRMPEETAVRGGRQPAGGRRG